MSRVSFLALAVKIIVGLYLVNRRYGKIVPWETAYEAEMKKKGYRMRGNKIIGLPEEIRCNP